jgi:hypothetical protein
VAEETNTLKECARILGFLYNSEILEEGFIISWFEDEAGDKIKEQVGHLSLKFYFAVYMILLFPEKYATIHPMATNCRRGV